MKKLKVVTIVGTRPEIIRLSRLIPKLDEFTDHVLVHTGQNYDRQLNEVFFEDLELRPPDYFLNVDTGSFGTVMGDTIVKSEEVFLKEKPDAVMILGDTNSSIAAVVAERMHIPVYHMEAGNRSFDNNVPEELNRRMVDHVATFNLPYNDYSMRNLLREGIHPRFIHKTGSPVLEVYNHFKPKVISSSVLESLRLSPQGYFLASLHRQENVDEAQTLDSAIRSLQSLGQRFKLPVLVSTHPRTRSRLEGLGRLTVEGITFHEPFNYSDYNQLQLNSRCVISDSGTIFEEAAVIGFPAVSFRHSSERPESFGQSTTLMSQLDSDSLVGAVSYVLAHSHSSSSVQESPEGYSQVNFSDNVLSFLISTAKLSRTWKGLKER